MGFLLNLIWVGTTLIGVAGGLAAILALRLMWMRLNKLWDFKKKLRRTLSSFGRDFREHAPSFTKYFDSSTKTWDRFLERSLTISEVMVLFGVCVVYIAARAYIVIESFISLRHVPIRVYETPDLNFMNYIPHL